MEEMMTRLACTFCLSLGLCLGFAASVLAAEQTTEPGAHAIPIPAWFKEGFLDLPDDIKEAAKANKRLFLYFGQDGCPYCTQLMQVNFGQKDISDKTRKHFDAIAFNIWGDREVTWTDGKQYPEKEFARMLKVQFTPTVLMLDEQGKIVLRLNGYYPPHKFRVALDYVSGKMEHKVAFADFLKTSAQEPASGKLHDQAFFNKPPHQLDRSKIKASKPLAVLFEQPHCAHCDEMHNKGFSNPATKALLNRFEFVRLSLFGKQRIVTTEGKNISEADWGKSLNVAYTPTLVFFDELGKEVFRVEAYLKPFHLASSLEYVASGIYRTEPQFQKFVRARAERIRAQGAAVELWED
jgi:thioredoxin-related protein